MTIEFHCPHCDKLLRTADEKAGARAQCPGCGESIVVPAAGGETAAGASADEAAAPESAAGAPPLPSGAAAGESKGDTKLCPMCGAEIRAAAIRCRFCGEALTPEGAAGPLQPRTIDAGEVITTGWAIFKAEMGMLIGGIFLIGVISTVAGLPSNVLQTLLDQGRLQGDAATAGWVGLVLLNIASSLLGIYLSVGQHIFLLKAARGEGPQIGDIFSGGRYFLRMLGNSIVFGLAIGLGFVACIVPGILLALMFWPYAYLLVDRNLSGLEPLNRAREITRPNWGSVFLLGLATLGINLLGLLACCVGVIFTSPLTLLMFAVAYCRMTGQPTVQDLRPS